MGLRNAQTYVGATGYTITGGTATDWSEMGQPNGSKLELVIATDPILMRRSATISVKEPAASKTSPTGYTQQRASIVYREPVMIGTIRTVNTVKIDVAFDAQSTDTQVTNLLNFLAQAGFRVDWTNVLKKGTLV